MMSRMSSVSLFSHSKLQSRVIFSLMAIRQEMEVRRKELTMERTLVRINFRPVLTKFSHRKEGIQHY